LHSLDALILLYEDRAFDCDGLVHSLLQHHQLGAESGNNGDLELTAVILAFVRNDRIADARAAADRYLHHCRRNRSVLWKSLQLAIARLEAVEGPSRSSG
jgi:hypothetical protein